MARYGRSAVLPKRTKGWRYDRIVKFSNGGNKPSDKYEFLADLLGSRENIERCPEGIAGYELCPKRQVPNLRDAYLWAVEQGHQQFAKELSDLLVRTLLHALSCRSWRPKVLKAVFAVLADVDYRGYTSASDRPRRQGALKHSGVVTFTLREYATSQMELVYDLITTYLKPTTKPCFKFCECPDGSRQEVTERIWSGFINNALVSPPAQYVKTSWTVCIKNWNETRIMSFDRCFDWHFDNAQTYPYPVRKRVLSLTLAWRRCGLTLSGGYDSVAFAKLVRYSIAVELLDW